MLFIRLFIPILLLLSLPVFAAPVRTGHAQAELVAEQAVLAAGERFTVALRLKMDKHWHTYWRNPGDSGLPTTLKWTLPEGFKAAVIQWPTPRRIPVGPLMNYGYEDEVLLLVEIEPPASLTGAVNLQARADWLICREQCIPEGADLSLRLPVALKSEIDTKMSAAFAKTRALMPIAMSEWRSAALQQEKQLELLLSAEKTPAGKLSGLYFFPDREGMVEHSAAQTQRKTADGYALRLTASNQTKLTRLSGVLVAEGRQAWLIDVPVKQDVLKGVLSAPVTTTGGAKPSSDIGLGMSLLFALLGGLILNLMPCVFPVLSLKVLSFAEKAHGDRALIRRHGLLFALGVLVSFWILAAFLLVLRASGEQLGWGFQLQSPLVVTALAVLFFILALNLSGLFEFGQFVPGDIAAREFNNPYFNSFFGGVLAAVVASPCTAPFMGAALGFAINQSPIISWLVFTALAFGMALPYLILAWFPAWLKKLPKPGLWMIRLKQFLAFPLYGTVIWLAWVLGVQIGLDSVLWLMLGLLLLTLAIWLWTQHTAQRTTQRTALVWQALGLIAAVIALYALWPKDEPVWPKDEPVAKQGSAISKSDSWGQYSRQTLIELQQAGKAVFVDFTAAWCVTCQANKQLVLNTEAVQEAFKAKGVVLLRADWTLRDPAITEALAEFGRNGVPVYVLYRPGKEPLVLPEVLSKTVVLESLGTL